MGLAVAENIITASVHFGMLNMTRRNASAIQAGGDEVGCLVQQINEVSLFVGLINQIHPLRGITTIFLSAIIPVANWYIGKKFHENEIIKYICHKINENIGSIALLANLIVVVAMHSFFGYAYVAAGVTFFALGILDRMNWIPEKIRSYMYFFENYLILPAAVLLESNILVKITSFAITILCVLPSIYGKMHDWLRKDVHVTPEDVPKIRDALNDQQNYRLKFDLRNFAYGQIPSIMEAFGLPKENTVLQASQELMTQLESFPQESYVNAIRQNEEDDDEVLMQGVQRNIARIGEELNNEEYVNDKALGNDIALLAWFLRTEENEQVKTQALVDLVTLPEDANIIDVCREVKNRLQNIRWEESVAELRQLTDTFFVPSPDQENPVNRVKEVMANDQHLRGENGYVSFRVEEISDEMAVLYLKDGIESFIAKIEGKEAIAGTPAKMEDLKRYALQVLTLLRNSNKLLTQKLKEAEEKELAARQVRAREKTRLLQERESLLAEIRQLTTVHSNVIVQLGTIVGKYCGDGMTRALEEINNTLTNSKNAKKRIKDLFKQYTVQKFGRFYRHLMREMPPHIRTIYFGTSSENDQHTYNVVERIFGKRFGVESLSESISSLNALNVSDMVLPWLFKDMIQYHILQSYDTQDIIDSIKCDIAESPHEPFLEWAQTSPLVEDDESNGFEAIQFYVDYNGERQFRRGDSNTSTLKDEYIAAFLMELGVLKLERVEPQRLENPGFLRRTYRYMADVLSPV